MIDSFGRQVESDAGLAIARSVRSRCDHCGSRAVEMDRWSVIGWADCTAAPDVRAHIFEGFEHFGFRPVDDPVVWVCLSCGNLGIFSDPGDFGA